MVSGLTTSAQAMDAQAERLAVLANNLANVGAVGFKAEHTSFFQLLPSPRAAGSVSPSDPAAPLLARATMRTGIDFSPGPLRETGNPLDVALEDSGAFFVVGSADAPRLTRGGAFTRNRDGDLAMPDGTPVLDAGRRPIRLPAQGALRIDATGAILADGAPLGQLLIVAPPDPARLTPQGNTRFLAPGDLALEPAAGARVIPGTLEQSNMNPVLGMVEMIDALRIYEAAQKAARAADETLGRAINDVGRTS
jgi:flagellar basal body rod protein FlgG